MRLVLLVAFVFLSAGYVGASLGPDGLAALSFDRAFFVSLGHSGAVVAALLLPALLYMLSLVFERAFRRVGWPVAVVAGLAMVGVAGLLATGELGAVIGS